ncbi:hypothetical protein [Algoriphagus sp. AK58]|uniref:hypothetical protein n=1 Tax=Algoriphagus sp. AK58 TaxID=1406877 RepID=UPI00164F3262|nr:hypothetical protein [Algoriphagus sp. AK58]MBC6368467.1 hypothetical protein [Algoriphagus sp. AK58]
MVVNEQQSFRGTFLMYGIILLELPTLVLISTLYFTGKLGEDGWIALLIVGTLMPLAFFLFMNITLETRMDDSSFRYKSGPFQSSWKTFKKEDIKTITVHKKDGFLDYGGIGIRFSGNTKVYIFLADHVIEIETGKRKLVFSTHKPREFEEMIESWKSSKS